MTSSDWILFATLIVLVATLSVYSWQAWLTRRALGLQALLTCMELLRQTRKERVGLSDLVSREKVDLTPEEKAALEATGVLNSMAFLALQRGLIPRAYLEEVQGPPMERAWKEAAPHIESAARKLGFKEGVLRKHLRLFVDDMTRRCRGTWSQP